MLIMRFYTQGGAEFNFYFDSEATYKAIHSGLEISIIGAQTQRGAL